MEKKHICNYPNCERAFVRQTDLRIHILRVHSSEKPFHCLFPGCNKGYVTLAELRRHYTVHTNKVQNML